MEQFFTGIRKKEQGNKFVTKYYIHVITRKNIEQEMQKSVRSDVVIPNKLDNGETCQGLRHWRLLSNLKNNFSKPVRNDMINNIGSALPNRQLNKLDCFAFARNDEKTVKNLFPYSLISFSPKKKIDSSPNALALNGYGFALMLELVRLRMTAFTLAEVLITLGIIGIVAAMTIPNLMTKNIQKQTVVKLQKAISIMNQAYKMSFDDVGEANINEAFEMGADKYFETYWAPYIKAAVLCNTYQQCGYKRLNPWTLPNGNDAPISLVADDSRVAFYTNDGFLYVILTASGIRIIDGKIEYTKNSSIIVDLNGNEGPNRFGRDVFMLKRISDGGGVQPYGYNLSDATVNSSCINLWYGNTCAEKIRRAGWRIDKDYPWK